MEIFDIKKACRELYSANSKFHSVNVPEMNFLMADGKGNPNTASDYAAIVETLYIYSYAIRALAKEELGRVHVVAPLEGLWSAEDFSVFRKGEEDSWEWTMMIVQPEWISEEMFIRAKALADKKKAPRAGSRVRFEAFEEGECIQYLHIGSYDSEAPAIAELHDVFLPSKGLQLRGRHHEIYLSDARKTDADRLRTIIRQPVSGKN